MNRFSLFVFSTLVLTACSFGSSRPDPLDGRHVISLTDLPPVAIDLPQQTRAKQASPPDAIPLTSGWSYAGKTSKEMYKYEVRLPIRPRGLFFHRAQPGMTLTDASGTALPYDRYRKRDVPYWWHDRDTIYVLSPEKVDASSWSGHQLRYPTATERERRLNLTLSGYDDPLQFAHLEANDGWTNRNGLLIPAPGHIAWDVEVPPSGELSFTIGSVAPEIREVAVSDDATLQVEVTDASGEPVVLKTIRVREGRYERERLNLETYSGQTVRLTLRSGVGKEAGYDYVFVGEPMIATRRRTPQRVVLVFIDTLRPDHMSLYGYARPTSAAIDDFANEGAVFSNARSIAPWTLPSARTVITGRQPEFYDTSEALPDLLRAEGYATAMFAGNVYLSANFQMTKGWGTHKVSMWPSAKDVTNDAIRWLEEHDGQDALLQVHYMDPHLPYKEPGAYRHLFAGEGCCGLREEFHLSDVRAAKIQTDEERQYIKDRYDNNIRYATDQIARLFETLGPEDVVVLFSDHGEEFWDHRQFEHGHTLFDELLRVPLAIHGPNIPSGRVEQPVSLLDITPTVLDVLNVPHGPMDGVSLLPAMRGDADALALLETRDLAFGRPLYGTERWGVLSGEQKWSTHEGREALYDLGVDAGEQNNLLRKNQNLAGPELREAMGRALGRDAPVSYRLVNTVYRKGVPKNDLVATVHVPGGVRHHWVGEDPLNRSSAATKMLDDETLEIRWHAGFRGTREVYFVPEAAVDATTHALHFAIADDGMTKEMYVPKALSSSPGKVRTPIVRARLPNRTLGLTWGLAPVPAEQAAPIQGRDDEMNALLEAMGYVAHDEEPASKETAPTAP